MAKDVMADTIDQLRTRIADLEAQLRAAETERGRLAAVEQAQMRVIVAQAEERKQLEQANVALRELVRSLPLAVKIHKDDPLDEGTQSVCWAGDYDSISNEELRTVVIKWLLARSRASALVEGEG